MKKLLSLAVGALCLAQAPLFGNGGTFNTTDVKATGNLVPQRKNRIFLDKELLNIRFVGDSAEVTVTYTLRNTGGEDKFTYGFPIDAPTENAFEGEIDVGDKGITGYRIEDNGKSLVVDKIIKKPELAGTEEPYNKPVRNWYMTDLQFSKKETKTLRISYKVKLLGTVEGTSKEAFWAHSPVTFLYTLQPSQSWGDGRVGQLDITADVTESNLAKEKVDVDFPGAASDANGNMIRWSLKNYDLRKAPDLKITLNNSIRASDEEMKALKLDRKYIKSIRASSTHEPSKSGIRYDAENLLDGKLSTAWIEGAKGPGIGEWIEIEFKEVIALKAISLVNGYCKDEGTLYENGQVMQVHVDLYDAGDRKLDWTPPNARLERTKYEAVKSPYDFVSSQIIVDAGDGAERVKKVRLKIRGAEPGSEYEDTAISEIFIFGQPVKK